MRPKPLEILKLREKGIAIGKELKVIRLTDLMLRVEWLKRSFKSKEPTYPFVMKNIVLDLIDKAFENAIKKGGQE